MALLTSIKNNATGLALFAFFTAGIVAITQMSTKTMITDNQKQYAIANLSQLISPDSIDNLLLESRYDLRDIKKLQQIELLNLKQQFDYYLGEKNQQVNSIILPVVAPEGYTDAIKLLVAINTQGQLLGVRVIEHKETPGLGDKIEVKKNPWILDFNEKSLNSPVESAWKVNKDGGEFDSFTGATITPRAVVLAVKQSLQFFALNQGVLMQKPANLEKTP